MSRDSKSLCAAGGKEGVGSMLSFILFSYFAFSVIYIFVQRDAKNKQTTATKKKITNCEDGFDHKIFDCRIII